MSEQEYFGGLGEAFCHAVGVHWGQLDKNGFPYIRHVLRVMARVETHDEMIVAALHDTIEDGGETVRSLTSVFSPDVVRAVDLISRRKGEETYAEYIDRLASNPLARAVKIADLLDHLDPSLPRPADYGSLKPRYEKALAVLQGPTP